jgi:hypothetical protein
MTATQVPGRAMHPNLVVVAQIEYPVNTEMMRYIHVTSKNSTRDSTNPQVWSFEVTFGLLCSRISCAMLLLVIFARIW